MMVRSIETLFVVFISIYLYSVMLFVRYVNTYRIRKSNYRFPIAKKLSKLFMTR